MRPLEQFRCIHNCLIGIQGPLLQLGLPVGVHEYGKDTLHVRLYAAYHGVLWGRDHVLGIVQSFPERTVLVGQVHPLYGGEAADDVQYHLEQQVAGQSVDGILDLVDGIVDEPSRVVHLEGKASIVGVPGVVYTIHGVVHSGHDLGGWRFERWEREETRERDERDRKEKLKIIWKFAKLPSRVI